MITAPNTNKVNRDAIKFLSKMIGKPLAPSINALAALNEFSALLNEQIKLVAAKMKNERRFSVYARIIEAAEDSCLEDA